MWVSRTEEGVGEVVVVTVVMGTMTFPVAVVGVVDVVEVVVDEGGLNRAFGRPQTEDEALRMSVGGSGALDLISSGIALRGKNQIAIYSDVYCMAKMPPPMLLKFVPYELVSGLSLMLHPAFAGWSLALTSQFEVTTVPLNRVVSFDIVTPAFVCRVMRLKLLSLTFSTISISPAFGQLAEDPSIQNAGQSPQVEEGICKISAMTRLWLKVSTLLTRTLGRPTSVGYVVV